MNNDVIVEKLDRLISLTALSAIQGIARREQIELLSKAGFPPKEIASILSTTSNTISVELSAIRKGAKKKSNPK